jgi:polar amino acid transport system substrate-binding protein
LSAAEPVPRRQGCDLPEYPLDGPQVARRVQQAVGTAKAAAAWLRGFVEEAKASGLVARFIEQHKVSGLSVAPPG